MRFGANISYTVKITPSSSAEFLTEGGASEALPRSTWASFVRRAWASYMPGLTASTTF